MTVQGQTHAMDVAVPLVGGRGVVHVGIARDHIEKKAEALPREMLLLALLLVAASVAVAAVFVRTIVRPLREPTDVAAHIVESGDLTRPIHVTSGDEVGRLARSFSQVVEKLREVTINLQQAAEALKQSTEHLNASSAEQAQTVSRQAAALQETQVTAQEIKQTSLLAAQKAERGADGGRARGRVGRAGETAIELQPWRGCKTSASRWGRSPRRSSSWASAPQQIGGITQTVKDLADQSNMLALNAAIEAVRSRRARQGLRRGGARDPRAGGPVHPGHRAGARDPGGHRPAIVTAAVRITERGAERMEAGLAQVRTTGENLQELANIVQDNAVGGAADRRRGEPAERGHQPDLHAVNELSKMMDETVARIGSTGEAATTLQIISEQLSSAVKSYRVE